ncbi:DUF2336 domain-containing protein [Tepidicaulis sp. LMO-SS28]|uniref:DUF2336 domain-containing protein n=1 Tax=Tepidicaulis sp. LMO-SS28 TaxID=3447455 RepID=UPI003EE40CBA
MADAREFENLALSERDIERLLTEPSDGVRTEVAVKVAGQFENVSITLRQRELAQDILGFMVHDAAVVVRESLSKSLSTLPEAPRDIVLALARDIDQVALPVLEESPVLTDMDLLEIVVKGSAEKQVAIAGRAHVSSIVSDALVQSDNRRAVVRLVGNAGADITEETMQKVAELYGDDDSVAAPLVRRGDLPVHVAEHLVTLVSERLRDYLIEQHGMGEEVTRRLIDESRERATINLVDSDAQADEMPHLVRQLASNNRLTPSIILRAACFGEMRFVEAAVAFLTGLPDEKVWRLVHDEGPLGFRAAYSRAGLPEALYPAFRVALDVYHDLTSVQIDYDRASFRARMVERVLTQYEGMEAKDLDFLLAGLAKLMRAEAAQAKKAEQAA